MRLLIMLTLTVSSISTVLAQDSRISLSPLYNIPLGKMAWAYKPGIGAKLSYSKVSNSSNIQNSSTYSISYSVFKPQADTLYYVIDQGGNGGASIGKASYSEFKMLQLQAAIEFAFPLGKKMAFTLGGGLGIMYGKREMYFEQPGSTDDMGEIAAWGTITPTAGFEFILSEHVSIIPYVSYTMMLQLGSTDTNAIDYNPGTGSFYHYYSPGISLNFNF